MRQRLVEFFDLLMGFRKLICFLLVLGVAVIFRIMGFISGDNFTDLIKNTFISFVAANGVEHFTTMAKDFIASKASSKADNATDAGT